MQCLFQLRKFRSHSATHDGENRSRKSPLRFPARAMREKGSASWVLGRFLRSRTALRSRFPRAAKRRERKAAGREERERGERRNGMQWFRKTSPRAKVLCKAALLLTAPLLACSVASVLCTTLRESARRVCSVSSLPCDMNG